MLKTIFVMILFVSLNCFPEQKMVKIEPVPNESTPSPPPAWKFAHEKNHHKSIFDNNNNGFHRKNIFYPTNIYFCHNNEHFKIEQFVIDENHEFSITEKHLEIYFQFTNNQKEKIEKTGFLTSSDNCISMQQEYNQENTGPRIKRSK